jgi:hypothetical protein
MVARSAAFGDALAHSTQSLSGAAPAPYPRPSEARCVPSNAVPAGALDEAERQCGRAGRVSPGHLQDAQGTSRIAPDRRRRSAEPPAKQPEAQREAEAAPWAAPRPATAASAAVGGSAAADAVGQAYGTMVAGQEQFAVCPQVRPALDKLSCAWDALPT